jgi:hypothetical protein
MRPPVSDQREVKIHRQTAAKVAAQLLAYMKEEDRTLPDFFTLCERLVAYFENGLPQPETLDQLMQRAMPTSVDPGVHGRADLRKVPGRDRADRPARGQARRGAGVTGLSLEEFLGEERPWPEMVHHLSASSVGMLFRCPRQFQRRYIFGEKERPGESIVVGSIFHEAIQHNYTQKIHSHIDLPMSEVVQYLQDEAVPRVVEESGGIENVRWDSDLDTARKDAERMTAAYTKAVVPRIQPAGVEARFDISIEGLPVPVIGYVDAWDAERTLDTKTGKTAASKVKPSWRLQGGLYAYATGRPTEYHSISRAATPKIVTGLESEEMIVPVPSEGQFENTSHLFYTAYEQVSYFWERYGEEQDWPTFGAVPDFTRNILPCDFCGWREGCPAWA